MTISRLWKRKQLDLEVVERLDHTRSRHELGEHFARYLPMKVDGLDTERGKGSLGVVGVGRVWVEKRDGIRAIDNDAVIPGRQRAQDRFQIHPAEGYQHDIRLRGSCDAGRSKGGADLRGELS